MSDVRPGVNSALFGSEGHTSVSRGLGEFQGRRPVVIATGGGAVLALPVEGLDERRLIEFRTLSESQAARLIITERRALGLDASTPMALQPPSPCYSRVLPD